MPLGKQNSDRNTHTHTHRHSAEDFKVPQVADVRVAKLAKDDLSHNGRATQLQQQELRVGKEVC